MKKNLERPQPLFKAVVVCEAWLQQSRELSVRPAILLLSGGTDSMLLWAVLEICMQKDPQCLKNLVLAHVGYPFRKAAEFEYEYICNKARSIPRKVEVCRVHAQEVQNHNWEAIAREKRHQFCHQLLTQYPNAFFLTGRHGQDLVEDMWLRMFRTPTPWTWSVPSSSGIEVYRPFETLTRNEIRHAYEYTSWLAFEDHTNTNMQFERNRLRHQITCSGQALKFPHKLLDFVQLHRAWDESLKQHAIHMLDKIYGQGWQSQTELDLTGLRSSFGWLIPLAVWMWLASRSGVKGVNTTRYFQLLQACEGIQFPKLFDFPDLGSVVLRKNGLTIRTAAEKPDTINNKPMFVT